MDLIKTIEQEQMRTDHPEFGPGDTVRVHVKVVEGNNERIQVLRCCDQEAGGGLSEDFHCAQGLPRCWCGKDIPAPFASY